MIDPFLKRFLLKVPDDNAEQALSATIFNYVCLGVMAFLAVAGLGAILIFVRKAGASIVTIVLASFLFMSILLARRVGVKAGTGVLIVGLWSCCTIQIWLAGGLDSIFASMYVAIIAIAAVLLGPSLAIISAVATMAAAFCMTALQSIGYALPNYYPMPPWSAWLVLLLPILLIVPTINGTMRAFLQATAKAREEIATRREAEEAARESEERYRSLFEHMGNAVVVYKVVNDGEDFIFFDCNRAAEKLENFSKEKLLGRSVLDVFPSVREFGLFEVFQRVWKSGNSEHHPLTEYKDDRIARWRDNYVYKLPSGEIVAVYSDETERKKAVEGLRESESKYRFFVDHASDVLWTLDLDLRTTFVSPSIEKVLGFTTEERMQQVVEEQLTPESLDCAQTMLLEQLQIEQEGEIQEAESALLDLNYWHKNGSIVCLQTAVTFIRNEDGTPVGIHGISRDITERKRAEDALKESERRLSTLMANLPGMAYRCVNCRTWTMEFVSDGTSDLTGYSPSDLVRDNTVSYGNLIHPDDRERVWEQIQDALAKGRQFELEYRVRTRSGQEKWVWERGIGLPPEGTQERRIEGFILDVTEHRRLQEQLRQSQRLEAIGTLVGGIAHDFNNLLTVVNGYTEMTLLATDEDDPRYEDLQKVLGTGRKGADLVSKLLALTKNSENRPEPLDLNTIVEASIALMRRTFPKFTEIEWVIGDDLGTVNADSAKMEQVLMNLLVNAQEAMPHGGRLKVETRSTIVDEDYCSRQPGAIPGRYAFVEISDTGTGMSNETLDRIFDPFFTTKNRDFRKGTGLGLPVARGIVEQHGGWITCQSKIGTGTVFRLYIPTLEDSKNVDEFQKPIQPLSRRDRILMVDDEELVRDLGMRILERAGYSVVTASNGNEAVRMYEREKSNIALVILDLIMPQMGGEKCLDELLRLNPNVRVVVSSGHSLSQAERDKLDGRVLGFVNKPYRLQEFLEVTRRVLGFE